MNILSPRGSKMSTSVPGFLTKTFEIFSTPEYGDICGWGPNGDTIIIKKVAFVTIRFRVLYIFSPSPD
jgi:hypothetical protein